MNPVVLNSISGGSGTQEQPGQTTDVESIHTQPLVEVFTVEAGLGVTNGLVINKIVVSDENRDQIIYQLSHQSQDPSYGDKLALTGPNKAISAQASFAIQVHGIISSTDVSGVMLWDRYADNVEYDRVLTGHIISKDTSQQRLAKTPAGTDNGQHSLAKVAYAVLSDAVEATVDVKLLLPGNASVYGKISAYYAGLQFKEVVLFERRGGEKLELAPSAADSMAALQLGRSVLAVSLLTSYSAVDIHLQLHVLSLNNKVDVLLEGFVHFKLDKHTRELRLEQHEDLFVHVDWTTGEGSSASASRPGGTSEQQVKVQVDVTSPGFQVSPL